MSNYREVLGGVTSIVCEDCDVNILCSTQYPTDVIIDCLRKKIPSAKTVKRTRFKKVDDAKELIAQGRYDEAMRVLDTIKDWQQCLRDGTEIGIGTQYVGADANDAQESKNTIPEQRSS